MSEPGIQELLARIQFLETYNGQLIALLNKHHIPLPASAPEISQNPESEEVKACATDPVKKKKYLYTESPESAPLNKMSPEDERIQLFLSLFNGRRDVYAQRYERPDKHGYYPVCINKNRPGCRIKAGIHHPCKDCPNTVYNRLTSDVIRRHFNGDEVIGIYTILPGDLCNFLAIDFDEDDWRKAISMIREVCTELDIPCAVEISRSGNGAHIWFFFEQEESAALARRFGHQLIGLTLNRYCRMSFSSYDRMFPNQDIMPKGGLGNLIALPLQKTAAMEKQGSLFADEQFRIYRDQWAYLSTVRRVSHSTVVHIADEMDPPVVVRQENAGKPWIRPQRPTIDDFPEQINITLADCLYIDTQGLSDKALTAMRSIATFRNPEYYKKKNSHQDVHNTPRYISAAEFDDNYLVLPRGCLDDVTALLTQNSRTSVIHDEREAGKSIQVNFSGTLREEQPAALKALSEQDSGILNAATGFGKTVVAVALIAEKKVNTLVLVDRKNLADQWKAKLSKLLVINETLPEPEPAPNGRKSRKKREIIGIFSGNTDTRSGIIDIATIQSVGSNNNVKEWIRDYGMVIVDECHHIPAASFSNVIRNVKAKYVYGLTATPKRADGLEPLIYMFLGPIRYNVDAKTQAMMRPFSHQMIPRLTGGNYHLETGTLRTPGQLYGYIAEDDFRNAMILEDVTACIAEKRSCLVLSERVSHVHLLAESIRKITPNTFVLTGGLGKKQLEKEMEDIHAVSPDEPLVICATGGLIGEGFDLARLDTLFLTIPISWEGKLSQYAGRLDRLYERKTEVRIYDYIDNNTEILAKMYNKRLKGYNSIGYQACFRLEHAKVTEIIYRTDNYREQFTADLSGAMRSIRIASPFVAVGFINQIQEILREALGRRVKITILCSTPVKMNENANTSMKSALALLNELGISVTQSEDSFRHYAVIDERIVWYGGINLLGGTKEENMIRLVGASIAEAVLKG